MNSHCYLRAGDILCFSVVSILVSFESNCYNQHTLSTDVFHQEVCEFLRAQGGPATVERYQILSLHTTVNIWICCSPALVWSGPCLHFTPYFTLLSSYFANHPGTINWKSFHHIYIRYIRYLQLINTDNTISDKTCPLIICLLNFSLCHNALSIATIISHHFLDEIDVPRIPLFTNTIRIPSD